MRVPMRHCRWFPLVVVAAGMACGRVALGDEPRSSRSAGNSIQLPSGAVFKIESLETHPVWKQLFPPDRPFFVEQYPEGKLQGMHSRYMGRRDGASVMLHENGRLKMLAFYPGGHCEGPCRVWDEDAKIVLYALYKDDKKDGITCLLKDGAAWLVQEWNMGSLEHETVVARKGSGYLPVDDAQQLAEAQQRLSAVENERVKNDNELKEHMRQALVDTRERIEEVKDKVLTRVAHAQARASEERIRQEMDARVAAAGARSWGENRAGRVAGADEGLAGSDLKAANKNAAALTNEAKRELHNLSATFAKGSKEQYQFAMAALEAATRPERSRHPTHVSAKESHRQKTFVVTYRTHDGKTHTTDVHAPTAAEAKEKVRENEPRATFTNVKEK